ncbi:lipoyl(octanoyl) transferase LipB [Leptolyngbya sp. FACHB-261]|nr:lipoyl(octanoyl) transferase LipB [Leptolyngbya sp. FACHB-261]MBD2103199.1 lipoyl(octanoyl) transferase LipB [Leptolyngbya sp. FACHB-261]
MSSDSVTSTALRRRCYLYQLGQIPYLEVWNWQRQLVEARKQNPGLPDVLLLLEHLPVYTLGQGASLEFLKFQTDSTVELHRVERGGEVTYHCPGQLVAYPILNLNFYQRDLHWYLRILEEVVIRVLALYGLPAERIPGLSGVWVEGRKLAAVGIKVSRWLTMHGIALNVDPDLTGFTQIVPCGIADRPVGSLAQFCPEVRLEVVQQQMATAFATVLGLDLLPIEGRDPTAG